MSDEFLSAVTQGDVSKVKEMLSADAGLASAKDKNGVSAIMKAAYYRQPGVVNVLLEAGTELNIFEAAATGQIERVRALLRQDPELVEAFSVDGFSALSLSTFFGHRETAAALIETGADVNLASKEAMKVTPLHSAAASRQSDIASLLIEHGADVNAQQVESGFTPLHEAAANGDMELATLLLEHGANVDAEMNDGKTPLAFALERKQEAMAELLRARGAKKTFQS
jgi:ankyrin repeat protein